MDRLEQAAGSDSDRGSSGHDEDNETQQGRPAVVGFGEHVTMRHHIERIARDPRAELPAALPEATPARLGSPGEDLGDALDLAQVAALIGCSPWTVRHGLIPKGLPCFRPRANGKLIFYRQQVVRWILRQQRSHGGWR